MTVNRSLHTEHEYIKRSHEAQLLLSMPYPNVCLGWKGCWCYCDRTPGVSWYLGARGRYCLKLPLGVPHGQRIVDTALGTKRNGWWLTRCPRRTWTHDSSPLVSAVALPAAHSSTHAATEVRRINRLIRRDVERPGGSPLPNPSTPAPLRRTSCLANPRPNYLSMMRDLLCTAVHKPPTTYNRR